MHKTFCILTDYYNYTHAFSGSMNQSPSHSHPLGGMKYSCFSFSLPVTSENLWRPTSPVVPHFPNTWAWFSYCDANRTTRFVLLNADLTAGLWRTFNHFGNIEKILFLFFSHCERWYTSSANTLKVPSEKELNFFSCADRPSHMLTLVWTGTFRPLVLSKGYWVNKKTKEKEL